jgi:alpha-methylacyl-CoA racemase
VHQLFGRRGEAPVFPGNIVGDFAGGGMLCAMGILLAIIERHHSGKGQVIDAAMIDGASYLATFVHAARPTVWGQERGTNLLDGGGM